MRIKRLKLKGFIGIFHGMGKMEVEIDFDKNHLGETTEPKKIIFLSGGNGSGKTTILSQIHPFKESFDDRKNLIMDGEEGVKEIDIEHNGILYEIQHIMPVKGATKSYIKKNGTELNENGLVSSFKKVVSDELGITQEYFNIGKIGSNVSNFVNFTTTERKSSITKLLPNIEDYLELFSIVKEKYSEKNNSITYVANELKRLENKDNVEFKIGSLEDIVKNENEKLEENIKISGGLNSKCREMENDAEFGTLLNNQYEFNNKLNSLRTESNNLNLELEKLTGETIKFAKRFPEYNPTVEELDQKIGNIKEQKGELDVKVKELEVNISNYNERCVELSNDIYKLENKYNELSRVKTADLQEEYDSLLESVDYIEKSENKKLFKDLISTPNFLSNVYKIKTLLKDYIGTSLELSSTSVEDIISGNINNRKIELNQIQEKHKNLIELVQTKQDRLNYLNNNLNQLDILKSRPGDCTIDSCPFISNALKFQGIDKEIEEVQREIDNLKYVEIPNLEKEIDSKTETLNSIVSINNIESELTLNPIYSYFQKRYNIASIKYLLESGYNDLKRKCEEFIEALEEYIHENNEINTKRNEIKILKINIENNKNNNKELVSIKSDIESKRELKENTETNLRNSSSKKTEYESELTSISEDLNILLNFKNAKVYYEKKKISKSLIDQKISNLLSIKENYDQVKNKLKLNLDSESLLKNNINSNRLELNHYNNVLSKIEDFNTRKKELEEDFENISTIKNALDPNKGIPLLFIKSFIENTKNITNELLDIAYDGKFAIDFVISPKEFYITVESNGNKKNDIKEASQGEIALTTISLCLAILQESTMKFNVLLLDEIDGGLDTTNRTNFLDILNRQMSKMNVEQVFVISHNNAFDICDMDIIMLNGGNVDIGDESYMSNKNIIFKV